MVLKNQKNFNNKLNNVDLKEIKSMIDRKKTSLDERKDICESIIEKGFFQKYNDEYYDVGIQQGDYLSEDIAVHKTLNEMATYLLTSDESHEMTNIEKENGVVYKFISDVRNFDKKLSKEKNIGDFTSNNPTLEEGNIIYFLKKDENFKLPKEQTVKKSDFKDSTAGDILSQYNDFIENVKLNKNGENKFIVDKNIGLVKQDQIDSKNMLKGVFGYNIDCTNEDGVTDYSVLDLTNENVLLGGTHNNREYDGLLTFDRTYKYDDMDLIILDLHNAIDKCGLSKMEYDIILCRRNNIPINKIADHTGLSSKSVSRKIKKSAERIIEYIKKEKDIYDIKKMLN